MPDPTPAEELRTAAATLRRQAADDDHWVPLGGGESGAAVPALARPLADWLEHMAKACDSKIKAAGLVWDLTDPGQAVEAERFIAKGPSGLDKALASARAINCTTEEPK